MVKTSQNLVTSRALTYSGINGKTHVTVHETANTDPGTGADTHARLQQNGFTASWHWSVDDKEAIQSFPHDVRCWHAGDGNGTGNYNSIGIEICVNSDGDFKQAVSNASELIKMIMKQEGIPLSNVVQHNHWSGKDCPTYLRNGSQGVNWAQLKSMISGSTGTTTFKPTKPQTKPVKVGGNLGLVDWMKANDMDSRYSNREKLAKQYNIGNYSGTAKQNKRLLAKLKKGSPSNPSNTAKGDMKTNSIVDYLKSINESTSEANRRKLAKEYGVKNYALTGAKNTELLNAMRSGKKASTTTQAKGTVHLPASSRTWKTYKLSVQPVAKNSDWSLTPSAYGGLTYKILGKPYANVVTIKTGRGKRNIYVAPGTGAVIK